jgi:hypothetical protein
MISMQVFILLWGFVFVLSMFYAIFGVFVSIYEWYRLSFNLKCILCTLHVFNLLVILPSCIMNAGYEIDTSIIQKEFRVEVINDVALFVKDNQPINANTVLDCNFMDGDVIIAEIVPAGSKSEWGWIYSTQDRVLSYKKRPNQSMFRSGDQEKEISNDSR